MDRALGSGLILEHNPLASVHAHGKVFFEENDFFTHTGKNDAAQPRHDRSISIGDASNLEETLAYLRLAFAQGVVRGKHAWFAELAGWIGTFKENYDCPEFLAEVRRLNDRTGELLVRDRSSVTETAFVIDEKSVAYLSLDNKAFLHHVYEASVSWGHTGAPFDLVLLDDLIENRCRPYRLIVPACIKSQEAVQRLNSWLRQTATRAWWDETCEWYPPRDHGALLEQMAAAGVHRYLEDGSTVWANASMVMAHVSAPGLRNLHFRRPCSGVEFFSGRPFEAPSSSCAWFLKKYETALFLIEGI
jgi:hypothetical protein